jgi:hypothetical protein
MWSLDDWEYLEKQAVTDPRGREWTVALMDVLGQKGDPDRPNDLLQMQYSQGRYFILIFTGSGIQYEQGYASLTEARDKYVDLLADVVSGAVNPAQPVFRPGEI